MFFWVFSNIWKSLLRKIKLNSNYKYITNDIFKQIYAVCTNRILPLP